ncbi:hypothetical protein CC79DRAFT_1347376 [Sarocladium strictum]
MWTFCPNLAASILFIALFALTTAIHLGQAFLYNASYSWVIIISGVSQVLTYIFRTLSIQTPSSFNYYAAWFVLILVAPLWTNAFAYIVFGRMVRVLIPAQKFMRIKGWQFAAIFLAFDVVAFVVQVYGAARASASDIPKSTVLMGLHIYMAGVGVQLLFIIIFCLVNWKMYQHLKHGMEKSIKMLFLAQMLALALIVLRIIFRIAEYAQGLDSTVPNHEAYQYCLDSLPMLVALVVYNIVHPARALRQSHEVTPSRRKLWSREKKHSTF